MKHYKTIFPAILLASLILGTGAVLLQNDFFKVEATGPRSASISSTQTIDLKDNDDNEIRAYYSSLSSLDISERKGTNILKNLKPLLQDFDYYSYDAVWKIYEITDREWALSPASGTTYGTYDATAQEIRNYRYGQSYNNPYVHTLYRNRDENGVTIESGRIREWGDHTQEGGTNREHVWCQSRGFKASSGAQGPAGTDIHHLMSGDGYVNGKPHNNNPYGYVDPNNITIDSKTSYAYCQGNIAGAPLHPHSQDKSAVVFEPQDSDKGDIARACFYMVACYNNLDGSNNITQYNPNLTLADYATSAGTSEASSNTHAVAMGILSDLLEWHKLDPVDEYEIHRNNLIYNNYQHNRNPFIDFPEWVDYIWGGVDTAISPSSDTIYGYNSGASVTGVSLDESEINLNVGASQQLTATVSPSNASNKTVKWTSSNNSVATVSNGLVRGIGEGTATITVTTIDGDFTDTCEVTVNESVIPPVGNIATIKYDDTFDPALPTKSDSVNTNPIQHTNGLIAFKEAGIYKGSGDYIMFAQNKGYLFNTSSLGTINSISVTYSTGCSTSAKIGVYFGSSIQSSYKTADNQTIAGQGQTEKFENNIDGNGYFLISTSNKNCQIVSITINYGSTTTVKVKSVSLDNTSLTLTKNEQSQLTATVLPANAEDKSVTWKSDDESVATVDGNGLITAINNGSTTITVTTTDGGYKAYCTVDVITPVTGISLNHHEFTLEVNEALQLIATIAPEDASFTDIYWESSNEDVATVESGIVTAIAPGNTTITVTTDDGGFTDSCLITVNEPSSTTPISTIISMLENGTYDNTEYTIKGTVTGIYGNSFYIQQGSSAMYIYNKPVSGNAVGKVIQVTATYQSYKGQYETKAVSSAEIIDEEPEIINPVIINDVSELNSSMQNSVVSFTGLTYDSGTYTVGSDKSITFKLNGNNVIYRTNKYLDDSVEQLIKAKIDQVIAAKTTATFNLVGVQYVIYQGNAQFNLYSPDQIVIVPNEATDKELVQSFIDNYMHMTDYTGTGTGLCLGADGYYMKAKKALTVMTSDQIYLFQNDDDFNDAQARYEAWASAYGDTTPYSTDVNLSNNINIIENNETAAIIVVVVLSSLSLVGLFVLIAKRKRKYN